MTGPGHHVFDRSLVLAALLLLWALAAAPAQAALGRFARKAPSRKTN